MWSKQPKTIIFAIIVVIASGVFIWKASDSNNNQNNAVPAAATEQAAPKEVSYEGVDGKNALELLKQKYKVETENYEGLGELVTSIEGVKPDKKHFWAFYVNGKQSQVGASTYKTKDNDKITWKLEEIR
ncbi:MAG TPA: DUF4430 domain-containing protein [Candidatus Saccharimonadales bacterium]|nr:DUF4430 domain-containing protein [Candidatus Saccharimonadales bacterium]